MKATQPINGRGDSDEGGLIPDPEPKLLTTCPMYRRLNNRHAPN